MSTSIEYSSLKVIDLKNELHKRNIPYKSNLLKLDLINLLYESNKQILNSTIDSNTTNNIILPITKINKKRKNRFDEIEQPEIIIKQPQQQEEEEGIKRIKVEKEEEEENKINRLFFKCFRNIVIRNEIFKQLKLVSQNYYFVCGDINNLINHPNRSYIKILYINNKVYDSIRTPINRLNSDITVLSNLYNHQKQQEQQQQKPINNLHLFNLYNNDNDCDNDNDNNSNIVNIQQQQQQQNTQNLIYQIIQNEKKLEIFKKDLINAIPNTVEKIIFDNGNPYLSSKGCQDCRLIEVPSSVNHIELKNFKAEELDLPSSVTTFSIGNGSEQNRRRRYQNQIVLNSLPPNVETLNINMDLILSLDNSQNTNNNESANTNIDTSIGLKTVTFFKKFSKRIGRSAFSPSIQNINLPKGFKKSLIVKKYHSFVNTYE